MSKDPKDYLPGMLAALDQVKELAKQFASTTADYRDELQGKGFTQQSAEAMAEDFHAELVRAAFQK